MQEDGLPRPVNHRAGEHTDENGGFLALLGQQHDDEQTQEHGDHRQNHLAVLLAHAVLNETGGHGAEEVPHDEEGTGVAVALGIDAGVGAEADVHEHQADGGADAQTHTQRNGMDNLVPDIEHAQQQEHNTLHHDDAHGGLEGAGVVGVEQGGDIAADDGEEAVQAHAGCHDEGLVGQESHADRAHSRGDTGGQKHGVPQRGAGVKVGEQIGIQGDDVGHRHEGGQTCDDLCFHRGAVLFQVK